ncbi:MAG: hypothetical protein N2035_09835 [Chthoniobacterales bacterium]|nr:hypothetical protein [Chthoniobacterales bacterium]
MPDFGWEGMFRSLALYEVAGDHRTFLENGERVAEIIEGELEKRGL